MGLFNHKQQVNPDGTVSNHHHTKADAALAGAAAHHGSNQHPGRNGVIAAGGVGEVQHHRNHNHDHAATHGTHGTHGTTGAGYGTAAGTGVGYGSAGHVNTGPAPLSSNAGTGDHSHTEKEATKLEKKGEMQSKIGNVLHSTSMKDKGAAKLAQADHLHMQASELSEAQRLEHEAGLRRQRAVGLGAHPSHASGTTGHGPTL